MKKSKGRGKEGCALLMSPRVREGRGTWMEGVQDNVNSLESRNSKICMGLCVCTRKCEKGDKKF